MKPTVKQIIAFQTTDGTIHADQTTAIVRQRSLDFMEWYEGRSLTTDGYGYEPVEVTAEEMTEWLDASREAILTHFNAVCDAEEAKDAERFRWLLSGNGYFIEHERLCGHGPGDEAEAREAIDLAMEEEG